MQPHTNSTPTAGRFVSVRTLFTELARLHGRSPQDEAGALLDVLQDRTHGMPPLQWQQPEGAIRPAAASTQVQGRPYLPRYDPEGDTERLLREIEEGAFKGGRVPGERYTKRGEIETGPLFDAAAFDVLGFEPSSITTWLRLWYLDDEPLPPCLGGPALPVTSKPAGGCTTGKRGRTGMHNAEKGADVIEKARQAITKEWQPEFCRRVGGHRELNAERIARYLEDHSYRFWENDRAPFTVRKMAEYIRKAVNSGDLGLPRTG